MVIDEFLNYMKFERNRSDLTVEGYGGDLKAFELYFKNLDNHLSWETIDPDVIRDWMESMMEKGNNATSVCRRLSALRSFYRYALMRKWVKVDPTRNLTGPKKSKPLPQFVKEEEMNRLLDSDLWTDSYDDQLDRTIIMTFYETGMRVSELTGLNDEAIDWEQRYIKVTGKRNKQRLIPFGDELCSTLRQYVKTRDENVVRLSPAFFLNKKGKRMNEVQVRPRVMKRLALVCTLKKRSPHVLRHSFATAMLNHNAGIGSVKKLLGHASVSTTEIYTHTTFEQLKKVYNHAHPRA